MSHVYADYTKARIGFFFGLTAWQLAAVTIGGLPVLWNASRGAWVPAGAWLLAWVLLTVLVITPVRGRSATGWLLAVAAHTAGSITGWTRFTSNAARGAADDLHVADLPGVLAGVQVHDAPPTGPDQRRVALIQDHAARTWAVTAAAVHPGIGMAGPAERDRYGDGLPALLEAAARTELIDEIIVMVRTVPDDGAERDQWITRHRRAGAPRAARAVNDDLQATLTSASVRTEVFVTIVVPESRLAKEARQSGGGFEGRARVLAALTTEVEAHLRGIIDALAAATTDPGVNTDVPWAMAGPSGACAVVRHYRHDAWNSISATLKLPVKGAVMGALAPVLIPGAGERRSFMVAYPIITGRDANRQSSNSQWKADMADGLRDKAKMRQRTASADEADKVRGLDRKLARGNALTRPYAVCTVTVPTTARVAEHGRRLDAAIRSAGFAPLRLDLSQDAAFAASSIPLGTSLTRKGAS